MNGNDSLSSLQRVLTTLGHQEPDRVPLFLLLSMHGAKELGLSIKKYFSRPENVVEGQLRIRAKYKNDCIYTFFYAPVEVEAWGAEVIYVDDGPPNTGEPFIHQFSDINNLQPPDVGTCPPLVKVLEATAQLKAAVGDDAPLIGVAVAPFSLPVMQMGFEKYLDLMQQPALFNHLMQVNQAFCVAWANAQLAAGATAICYFDPVASPTIIPPEMYQKTVFEINRQTLARINGPTATHFASGLSLPILDQVAQTGTAVVGVSVQENLTTLKAACRGKLTVLGNLNGIEMRRWSATEAEQKVKEAIAQAGPGGGFILSDNHGEIPWQVPEDTLLAISEAAHTWGHYPLDWVGRGG